MGWTCPFATLSPSISSPGIRSEASMHFSVTSFRRWKSLPTMWVLLDTAPWTVFPRWDALWRLYSRQSNLSHIACKFCCWMMLYMLFIRSLVNCSPRLTFSIWKFGKVSSCETIGGIGGAIRGAWTYPAIRGIWTRYACNITSSLGFAMFCGGGGGDWIIPTWTAVATSHGTAEWVALDSAIIWKRRSQRYRNSKNQSRNDAWSDRMRWIFVFDFWGSWFNDPRRFRTSEFKSWREIVENIWIRSQFPHTTFRTGTRNGVRTWINGGSKFPMQQKGGLTWKISITTLKSACEGEKWIEIVFEI